MNKRSASALDDDDDPFRMFFKARANYRKLIAQYREKDIESPTAYLQPDVIIDNMDVMNDLWNLSETNIENTYKKPDSVKKYIQFAKIKPPKTPAAVKTGGIVKKVKEFFVDTSHIEKKLKIDENIKVNKRENQETQANMKYREEKIQKDKEKKSCRNR